MTKVLRGLYKILNFVCENQCFFINSWEYARQTEQPKKIKGYMKWDDDWKNFNVFIIEDYFCSILNDIYRDIFHNDEYLDNFIPWLDKEGYLPYGLDNNSNANTCVVYINGIPTLCVCVRVDINKLKSNTVSKTEK